MTLTSKLQFLASKKYRTYRPTFVKIVLVSLLVILTCNSLFWFPFLQEQPQPQPQPPTTSDGRTSKNSGHHDNEENSILPTKIQRTTNQNGISKRKVAKDPTTLDKEEKTPPPGQPPNDDAPTINHNRTLVILTGNLRCGEQAWESLYTNLLDVNMADLALIGANYDDDKRYPNASLVRRAKYIWRTPEYDEWADALDLINGTSWRTRVLPQISNYSLDKGLLGGIFNTPSSGAIQGMVKWWLSQYIRNEPTIYGDNNNNSTYYYDTFVLTRTDQYYACPLDLKTALRRRTDVSIPRGEDYSGICDRFMVICGTDKLLEALDVLPPFLNDYDPKLYGKLHNPEGLLKATLSRKKLKVQRISRVMFTCASPDGQDHTRWRKTQTSNDVTPGAAVARREYGVDFKYKQEFALTRYQCVRKPKEEAATSSRATK
jgi:hypothetical protein